MAITKASNEIRLSFHREDPKKFENQTRPIEKPQTEYQYSRMNQGTEDKRSTDPPTVSNQTDLKHNELRN